MKWTSSCRDVDFKMNGTSYPRIRACSFVLLLLCLFILILQSDLTQWFATKEYEVSDAIKEFQGYQKKLHFKKLTSKMANYKDYKLQIDLYDIEQELQRRLKMATKKKIILIWTTGDKKRKSTYTSKSRCGNCEITHNKSLITDNRTAAVIYLFGQSSVSDVPTFRNPNQLHIFWTMESSGNLKGQGYSLEAWDSYGLNGTMTYRLDSDFLTSYQSWALADAEMGKNESDIKEVLSFKSKLAVCIISNCAATLGAPTRLKIINELKVLGLKIDTFGKCFSNRIDSTEAFNIIPRYKFYFAFENSYHCKDYITEKFFVYAFVYSHAVPVVWGAKKEDYEKIAPPGSFIFVDDFTSPEELIEYLEFLNDNDEEYLKFFRWRTLRPEALPQYQRKRGFCAVCRAVNGINVDYRFNSKYNKSSIPMFTESTVKMTIPSLKKWFYDQENPECFEKL